MYNEISIKNPSSTQIRKLKQGLDIRVKSGNDLILKCEDNNMYADMQRCFAKGKTSMICYNLETNIIISKTQNYENTTNGYTENNSTRNDEDKETIEKIIEMVDSLSSVDEYMNFAKTLFENKDKFRDNAIRSVIMSLQTLKDNAPYLISYNQYHMISVKIIKNLKEII